MKFSNKFRSLSLGLLAAFVTAQSAAALDTRPVLPADVAEKMIAACEAHSIAEGWRMNIAITDIGADLVMFKRMDGAFLGSVQIAIDKAKSSSNFPFPTRGMAQMSFGEDLNGGPLPGFAHVDGLIAFAGGLPIVAGGVHIGAIGVSGGSEDQDEVCAAKALEAVAAELGN